VNTGAPKTDRLDTELLKRAFLGWLRGERDHCKMVRNPTIEDEDGQATQPRARDVSPESELGLSTG